jgi:hypothetical protein
MPDMPSFMANNNFNGGFGYGRGDPNNNFFGSGYGYPGYPLDGGYSNSGGGGVEVKITLFRLMFRNWMAQTTLNGPKLFDLL